jgi:hypothetical protein
LPLATTGVSGPVHTVIAVLTLMATTFW